MVNEKIVLISDHMTGEFRVTSISLISIDECRAYPYISLDQI